MKLAIVMLWEAAAFGQTLNGTLNAGTGTLIPPQATFASAPSSPPTGAEYTFTDASAAGTCTGGGTSIAKCRWSGSVWQAVGGGGGGSSPGSPSGGTQTNNGSGGFTGQAFQIGGSLLTTTTFQRGVECATATIPYTSIKTSALTNSLAINASMPQKFRFEHMYLVESTQFVGTSITGMTVSAGTSGTYTDVIPTFTLLVSGGQNNWYDRPSPPAYGTSTWNFVLYFTSVGANLSALTDGNLYVEVCGYAVQ